MIEKTPDLRNRINQRKSLIEQNLLGKTTTQVLAISQPVLPVIQKEEGGRSIKDQLGGK